MNFRNKTKVSIIAMASAAAAILSTAPVQAAEKTTSLPVMMNVQAGFISGLETVKMADAPVAATPTVKAGIVKEDGKTVYVDQFGQKETGLKEEDGKTYYFDEDGSMATGFREIDGKTYYFAKDSGEMTTGEVTDGDKTWMLQEDGQLLTGWNNDHYYNEQGFMVTNQTLVIDGNRYRFDENGNKVVNKVEDGYSFDANGIGTVDKSAYQKIADAALAQLGRIQDCTMLVTNSLKAVGINFHGAPAKYLTLGPTTNDPVPGDIIVYSGHVAIYIGDGKAVHGGWNGNQTVVWSVECSTPFVAFVHPTLPA